VRSFRNQPKRYQPVFSAAGLVTLLVIAPMTLTLMAIGAQGAAAQTPPVVRVVTDSSGEKIQVDGRDFMIFE